MKKGGDVLKRVRNKSRVNFRFHDLRHTFATRLAEVAGKGEIVRELLGHTIVRDLLGNSARSTTDLYLHLNEQKAADAIMDMAATTQAALRALPTNKEETPR